MKLLSCHIENFGKFSDFSHNFTDLNVILQPNGWGKTTLCYFIKAMLFGFNDSKSKSASISERVRYLPFGGGNYGGSLCIEEKGKKYRIERFFGSAISKDTFALFDLATNLASKDFSAKIGEEITGINGDAFAKCLYFPQQKSPVYTDDFLTAKLSNLLYDENDVNNYLEAQKLLDNQRKIYDKKGTKVAAQFGSRGRIEAVQTEIETKQREIDSALLSGDAYVESKEKVRAVTDRIKALQSAINVATEKIKQEDKNKDDYFVYKEYEILSNEYRKLSAEFSSVLDSLGGSVLSEKELANIRTAEQEIVGLKAQITLLETQQKGMKKPAKTKSKGGIIALLTTLIAVCIGGGIFAFIKTLAQPIYLGCFGAAALLLTVLIICILPRGGKATQDYNKLTQQIDNLREKAEKEQQNLTVLLNKCNTESVAELESRNKLAEQLNVKASEVHIKMRQYADTHVMPQTKPAYNEEEVSNLRADIEKYNKDVTTCSRTLGEVTAECERYRQQTENLPVLQAQLEQLIEQKAQCEQQLKVIVLTKAYLEQARENLNCAYMPRLVESFNKYVALLDGTKIRFTIDSDLQVTFASGGQTRDRAYLSYGYNDIIDLCVRLALADCMFDNSHFLILDDPFTELDDKRTLSALELLKKLSQTRQIIYTSCNSSRV